MRPCSTLHLQRATAAAAALLCMSLASLAPARAVAQQCSEGRVASWSTQGRCCWPGQSFSPQLGRCVGAPQCPSGRVAAGDECVAPAAPPYVQGAYATVLPSPMAPTVTVRAPIWGLVVAGAVTFGAAWVAGPIVTAAVGGDATEIGLFAVPLAGPWICLGACYDPDDYLPAIVVDGVLQLAGLTMFILGFAIQHDVQVRADVGGGVRLGVLPWALPSSSPAAGASLAIEHL